MLPQSVAYLQAPYHDELSDFRITPSPGGPMLDHRYQDELTNDHGKYLIRSNSRECQKLLIFLHSIISANMVYGYVSSPYGTTNPAGKCTSYILCSFPEESTGTVI